MELWVVITLAAGAVQTLRFMLQKRLKGLGLSTGGATFSRFVYAAPIACAGAAVLLAAQGHGLPGMGARFWAFVVVGGLTQIVATFLTVALFSLRSFAVGIAFTKTETVQVAVLSALILAERVPAAGWIAILIGTCGVLLMSPPPRETGGPMLGRAVLMGVAAGGLFGLSAVGYRGATQELALDDAFARAVVALACVTSFQTLAMVGWLVWREPGEITRVLRSWRATLPVGITGVLGSAGWFVAFALQNAAYVRSLAQVELIYSLLASVLVFHERVSKREIAGIALLALSIIGIVSFG